MGMILHCGGRLATFEEVAGVELPKQTKSYRPVPNGDLVRLVEEEVKVRVGLDKPERTFGLSSNNQAMFGTLTYDLQKAGDIEAFIETPEIAKREFRFSIALRNSYDKSCSVGVCGGASVAVCDNLAVFHGSEFTIKVPHKRFVWENLVPKVMMKVNQAAGDYAQVVALMTKLRSAQLTQDEKFAMVGIARGRGILTSVQMTKCIEEIWDTWNNEDADFHEDRANAFGLYQNFTQSLKLGKDMDRKIDRYTGVSGLFQEKVLN